MLSFFGGLLLATGVGMMSAVWAISWIRVGVEEAVIFGVGAGLLTAGTLIAGRRLLHRPPV